MHYLMSTSVRICVLGALLGAAEPLCAQAPTPPDPPITVEQGAPEAELGLVGTLSQEMSAYAEGIAASRGVWRGPRVPWPLPEARPASQLTLRSSRWPVSVHGSKDAHWVQALDAAYALLSEEGWPLPPADGGRGETDGFDVYVVASLRARALQGREIWPAPDAPSDPVRMSDAYFDAPVFDAPFDSGIVFSAVSETLPRDRQLGCAVQLVSEAGLYAADPSEAPALRHATGAWLAWRLTGELGCDEDALVRQQQESRRAYVAHHDSGASGGSILIDALSQRHDDASTSFMRDVWTLSRQLTTDTGDMRAEPDVLRVIGQAGQLVHDPLDRVLESLAVARYFVGREGATRSDIGLLRALPNDARVPVFGEARWSALPRTLWVGDAGLEPWGSAYARVDVSDAPAGSTLRVWLEGEPGTEWSLVAVRLDSAGRELGRTRVPQTRRTRAFIPVELAEGAHEVVLVVTNMPDDHDGRDSNVTLNAASHLSRYYFRAGMDLDDVGMMSRTFRLIVDRGPS